VVIGVSELNVLRAVSKRALTQRELASSTKLSNRTIRYALAKLLSEDKIRELINLTDLRKKRYALK